MGEKQRQVGNGTRKQIERRKGVQSFLFLWSERFSIPDITLIELKRPLNGETTAKRQHYARADIARVAKRRVNDSWMAGAQKRERKTTTKGASSLRYGSTADDPSHLICQKAPPRQ